MSFKPRDQVSPHERARGRRSSTVKKKEPVTSPPQRYGERASGDSGERASGGDGDRGSGDGDESAPRKFLTGPQVQLRYSVSSMSLWRWLADPELGFPQPALRVRDRRYWLERDLIAWERGHVPHGDDATPPRSKAAVA